MLFRPLREEAENSATYVESWMSFLIIDLKHVNNKKYSSESIRANETLALGSAAIDQVNDPADTDPRLP